MNIDNHDNCEYEMYEWIEKHLKISESLYCLNIQGRHILNEIKTKKNIKQGRRGLLLDDKYDIIYQSIYETVNVMRFKSRLFLCLQYYLDEALFHRLTTDIEQFYIGDNSHDLTAAYFNQEEWIPNPYIQKFSLFDDKELNIEEALLIKCYLNTYEKLLKDIELLILSNIKEKVRWKKKIKRVINKIRKKHDKANKLLLDTIVIDAF